MYIIIFSIAFLICGNDSVCLKDEGVGRSEHGFTLLRHSGSTIIRYRDDLNFVPR